MILLGAIADDLTGATDLALTLSREGMRTIQVMGIPDDHLDLSGIDALVIGLKTRTIAVEDAVAQSLAACDWLKKQGAQKIFFKYCSTFDSTPKGNIGPVIDALMDRLGAGVTLACPAFPTNGRTVFQGHLFVGDKLLSDSTMRDHPLTPMTDSNLVRVLQQQSRAQVGLVPYAHVDVGALAIRSSFESAVTERNVFIVDAVTDQHLRSIGEAAADLALVTGGSGVALGLPENFRRQGRLAQSLHDLSFDVPMGRGAILAGSCSAATRRQIEHAIASGCPALKIDPMALASQKITISEVADWFESSPAPAIVYSSANPEEIARVQSALGREAAGEMVEAFLATLAIELRRRNYRRFIIAGGETSGAVVNALGVRALRIGPEIDPGVPWTLSLDQHAVGLALKSGNFGADDFFMKAWGMVR